MSSNNLSTGTLSTRRVGPNLPPQDEYYDIFSKGTAIPGLIDAQRLKYGEKLMNKNRHSGMYRCFYCNKDLAANFSRHIARHELEGDPVLEDIKSAIENDEPLPPPNKLEEKRLPKLSRLQDSSVWGSGVYSPSTPALQPQLGSGAAASPAFGASISTPVKRSVYQPISSVSTPLAYGGFPARTTTVTTSSRAAASTPTQNRMEAEMYQFIHMIRRDNARHIMGDPFIAKVIEHVEGQIGALVAKQVNNLYSFLVQIQSVARQFLAQNNNDPFKAKAVNDLMGYVKNLYRIHTARKSLLPASETCAVCGQTAAPSTSLLPCIGTCMRSFHALCCSQANIKVPPEKPQLLGKLVLCGDCEKSQGRLLYWDPDKRLHYYYSFSINDREPLPVSEISPVESEQRIKPSGVSSQQLILLSEPAKKETEEPTIESILPSWPNEDVALATVSMQESENEEGALFTESVSCIRSDHAVLEEELYYDPIWCVYRPRYKNALESRIKRHKNTLESILSQAKGRKRGTTRSPRRSSRHT